MPPRTKINPWTPKDLADPYKIRERQIPIYDHRALIFIEAGGKLDPYANPYPTDEQFAKEDERMKAVAGWSEGRQANYDRAYYSKGLFDFFGGKSNQQLADEYLAGVKGEQQKKKHAYRTAPEAEYYRLHAIAELKKKDGWELDVSKVKSEYSDISAFESKLKKIVDSENLLRPNSTRPVYPQPKYLSQQWAYLKWKGAVPV